MKSAYVLLVLVAIGAAGYGAYQYGMNQGLKMASAPPAAPAAADTGAPSAGGKKVLYRHDPMVPGQRFDKPGKSPFMDMQLVPVYAEGGGDQGNVSISPRMQQNLGVRTAEVTTGAVTPAVEAVGTVAWNERDVAVVQARSNGFLERLYVRAPLDPVRRGQPLAELYVPDWVAAQEEFLSIKRMRGSDLSPLLDGARQRMRLAGMNDEQIRLVEASGQVQPRLTLTAPIGGVIGELAAREGMTVMAGAPLFRINGLGTIWVNAEVPENIASLVRPGNTVEARAPALPGSTFKGKVSAILPEVNPATRTLKARVELANPTGQLVPGMFATVNFSPAARKDVLLVPTEAVITTGKRNVVIVAQGEGRFAPVDVELGMEANGQTEIRKGLAAGQKVVVSGQFLLDSEASLKGSALRMGDTSGASPGATTDTTHKGEAKVEKIGKDEIVLSHGPIASLQWPPMTMGFKPPPAGVPKDLTVGDRVTFEFHQGRGGQFEITAINRSGAMPAAKAAGDIKGMSK
jgi:Cu(I)/Ag(I) efflux system membrane fusion protein